MQENHLHIATTAVDAEPQKQVPMDEGYAPLLTGAGIGYSEEEVFLAVRPEAEKYDWCLCLSVIRTQIPDFLQVVLPLLREYGVPFRLAKDRTMALQLLNGKRGADLLNRILIIYPTDRAMANTVARSLVDATGEFIGPDIPSSFLLGGVVFTQPVRAVPAGAGMDSWPFDWVAQHPVPVTPATFGGKYRIMRCVKESVKGSVFEGVYLKRMFQVRKCLIKQGKKHMWSDDDGRDVGHRLQWQHQIQQRLKGLVDLPEALDLFTENGDTYLVMEYVEGPSVKQLIDHIYRGRHWTNLATGDKRKLLAYLLRIIDIVGILHENGFVHRDVTPSNFLIDKKDRIVMIDLELAYCIDDKYPLPPFAIGTNGFTSPQQANAQEPTYHEDIYAMGGMLTNFFTGVQPVKFDRQDLRQLQRNLFFFCRDREIANLVVSCFHPEPTMRPSLAEIKRGVMDYVDSLYDGDTGEGNMVMEMPGPAKIRQLISRAFRGIAFPGLSVAVPGDQLPYRYPAYLRPEFIGYLMVMDAGRTAGVNGYHSPEKFDAYRRYIEQEFFNAPISGSDLYAGATALALGTVWAMNLGILPRTRRQFTFIRECLDHGTDSLDLFSGIAGKGMALLLTEKGHQSGIHLDELKDIIALLGKAQLKDGAWPVKSKVGRKTVPVLGFARGVAGIIYFLLECYQQQKIDGALSIATRGMKWLETQATRSGDALVWTGSNKKVDFSLLYGTAGIAAVFIKAYDVIGLPGYRTTAEQALRGLPHRPVWSNYSLGTGLAGIGIVYTYAARVFRSPFWLGEASWIASVFLYSFQHGPNRTGRWNTDGAEYYGNDLLTGNAGVILFLIMLKAELDLPKMECDDPT